MNVPTYSHIFNCLEPFLFGRNISSHCNLFLFYGLLIYELIYHDGAEVAVRRCFYEKVF